jgi:hypothetical protein
VVFLKGASSRIALGAVFLLIMSSMGASGLSSWKDDGTTFYQSGFANVMVDNGELMIENNTTIDPDWINITGTSDPQHRGFHSMAYDSANNVSVLFGGIVMMESNYESNDTWIYNSSANVWKRMSPAISPEPRWNSQMAYDSKVGVMVLFGGRKDTVVFNDTWTYNVSTNTWTNMSPPRLPPYGDYVMAYDPDQDICVAFGGNSTIYPPETWAYSFKQNNWTKLVTIGNPPSRADSAMVYDEENHEMVLFGGLTGPNSKIDDGTWIFSPAYNAWAQKFPILSPHARSLHAMAYDSDQHVTVLFGGNKGGQEELDDTWVYDSALNTWTGLTPEHSPGLRQSHSLYYDRQANAAIVFGGWSGGGNAILVAYPWALSTRGSVANGTYTSIPFDTGGTAYFGKLHCNASVPTGTSIQILIRTGASKTDLEANPYVGQDGNADSFYIPGENDINSIHNGSRWIQYRAYFANNRTLTRPALISVTIDYNLLQNITITSPVGGDNWTGTQSINWSAQDPDNDSLLFDIYLVNESWKTLLVGDLSNSTHQWLWDTSSVPNGTYKIILVARDDNPLIPLMVNATSYYFVIYHYVPPTPNHPPRIISLPPTEVMAGDELNYHVTATDADGDTLAYSLVASPENISIDSVSGRLHWIPSTNEVGNYTIIVQVSDGRGGFDIQTFTVTVIPKPIPPAPEKPQCTIVYPLNGSKVGGHKQIRGTAINGTLPLTIIQVRIDGGDWMTAVGLKNWTLTVNFGQAKNGRHIVEARAFDGSRYSDTASVSFSVINPEPSVSSGGTPWCLPAAIIAIVAGLGVLLILRRKKGEPKYDGNEVNK